MAKSDPSTGTSLGSSGPRLLAVDLGLRTGLAAFGQDGRLQWYRSRNFGSRARLKNASESVLRELPGLSHVVVEGGGDLLPAWERAAHRAGIAHLQVDAHTWREVLLLPRHRRDGATAKRTSDIIARQFIEWSGASRPTSLRHDAAEAIMVGIWAVLKLGWLDRIPEGLSR